MNRETTVDRVADLQRARQLSAISVGLGVVLAIIAVALGIASGSLSMIGFGMDAAIDSAASVVLVWRFVIESRGQGHERAEEIAERLVSVVLLLAALALVIGAARALLLHSGAQPGAVQVALLIVSLVALPPLAWAKRRVADRLASNALRKDSLLTAAGALLALVALLAGQLGPSFGLWWADAVGSIVIAAVLAREGSTVLRGSRTS